jgi:hypothetical protein
MRGCGIKPFKKTGWELSEDAWPGVRWCFLPFICLFGNWLTLRRAQTVGEAPAMATAAAIIEMRRLIFMID